MRGLVKIRTELQLLLQKLVLGGHASQNNMHTPSLPLLLHALQRAQKGGFEFDAT
jgi:hypothetical protein